MYTMTVTGNHNEGTLKAVLDMDNGKKITLDDMVPQN
jgi:hypothetical protein